jgi:Na+-driven multidrug efflux pump
MCACFSTFVRNDGEIILPTAATTIGGIINAIGDALFVFDYGLGLGVFGAGLATAIGQVVAFALICSYYFHKKCKLRFTKVRKIGNKLATICALGISAFIIDIAFGICIVVFNKVIMDNLSADHLAVYSTASTVLWTTYCLFYACGNALMPIVSANFGANNTGRVTKTLKIASLTTLVIAIAFTTLIMIFPGVVLNLFTDTNDHINEIGPAIIRKFAIGIIPASFAILFSYYLQSVIEKSMSFTVSILRGLLLPILFVLTLTPLFGNEMIWYSVPLAEAITFAVALIFVIKQKNTMTKTHTLTSEKINT